MNLPDSFENILSPNLNIGGKGRLVSSLEQFKIDLKRFEQLNPENIIPEKYKRWNPQYYNEFYLNNPEPFFYQGDLLREIRNVKWKLKNTSSGMSMECEKVYETALLLSNSCDISSDNNRSLNQKQALFAPVVELDKFESFLLEREVVKEKINSYILRIKNQFYSNILYLPTNPSTNKDYIAYLDKIFWFPTEELNSYLPDIKDTRIGTLDIFGHYLFIIKLSYHLNRLPEEPDRRSDYFK